MTKTPQPAPERIVQADGHPLVVGVRPGQSELVPRTAASWAKTTGAGVYFGYADASRLSEEEFSDGRIRHVGLDPDADDSWQRTEEDLRKWLVGLEVDLPWHFRYLAGRADRALTHLARAVDACAIVVGAQRPGSVRLAMGRGLAQELARHQHRPVLTVPLEVVDWKSQ